MHYATGAIPSPPDARDYQVSQFNPAGSTKLPAGIDFRQVLHPVRNQGAEGTCVGHALTCVMGYQQITQAAAGQQPDREILSPRDAYEGARMIEPVPGGGEGAYPRAALKWAQRSGVCREDRWPYFERQRGVPNAGAEESRYANRILTYSRVALTPEAIKAALYWHGPILAAVSIDQGFEVTGADGRIQSRGLPLGSHAITIAGYDDARGAYLIRNSWGAGWGAGGDAWLPYSWPVGEAWICTPALDAPPPEVSWMERLFPWLFLG
jgi:C1A family cysteine protease